MFSFARHPRARAWGAIAWLAFGIADVAVAREHGFEIPSESAALSIPEFARQAGVQIVAPGNLGSTTTPAVSGHFEPHEALERLLTGTDLVIAADDGAVIALRHAVPPATLAETSRDPCKCVGTASSAGRGGSPLAKDDCMKRLLVAGGSSLLLACGLSSSAWAQTAAPGASVGERDTLQEVVVTAERRAQDVQQIAASVVVLQGADLAQQGRISTQQILEDVPNVIYARPVSVAGGGNSPGDNPNGNITVRGVQSTQTTGGTAGPSATATYVDDVYQGIGGDYDISRVEVLRGPQGTLYGRSATGGVVAFHTIDPQLNQFGGSAYAEYGTANLMNATAAVNLPIGEQLAVRIAAHEQQRDGFYWNPDGNWSRNQEARIKLLFQPLADLKILASVSTQLLELNSGGAAPTLATPTRIDYGSDAANPVTDTAALHYQQYSLNVSYDTALGELTYVGAMHNFSRNGYTGVFTPPSGVIAGIAAVPLDQFNSQEIRLASNPGAKLSWIVGASFYSQMFRGSATSLQEVANEGGPPGSPVVVDPNPAATPGTFMFTQYNSSLTTDYGLFTEETVPLRDNLRVTAGLRYDRTNVRQSAAYLFNTNLDSFFNSLSPPTNAYFSLNNAESSFDNVTYKLRAEYDLARSHLLYAMVSTGFLPGDTQISPVVHITDNPVTVSFAVLPYDQERLTSFEVGSKNRFLNDHLQVNASAFYYSYQGYQEAVNVVRGPVPQFVTVAVPVRMLGGEIDARWRPGSADEIAFSAGAVDAEVNGYSMLGGGLGSTQQYIGLKRLPGVPPLSAALSYQHTFAFVNGSKLIPRIEGRFTSAYYVENLSQAQLQFGGAFDHQGDYAIANAGLSWLSPHGAYSATAYVRNIGGTIYKYFVNGGGGFDQNVAVVPSDPRTYGISVSAQF